MPLQHPKTTPKWSDVKAKLAVFDDAALVSLIQDLYTANKDNRTFLHARFGLTEDALRPYKATIEQWIYPDVFGKEDISVSKAKKAISDYKKAIGHPGGLAELMVYYCEQAADFANEFGMQDTAYFNALVRMFEQAIKHADALPPDQRSPFFQRLDRVCQISHNFGYGVGEDMDYLLAEYDASKD